MTVRAWRITKAKHGAAAFTGAGAKTFGGRWNSPGTAVVYAAGTMSLAILEMLVHLTAQEMMHSYVVYEISFDPALITRVDPASLPRSWRRSPAAASVQRVGDAWAADAASAVLRVPSVVVPSEWNYLLNPAHADFAKITIGPRQTLKLDPRLVKQPRPL